MRTALACTLAAGVAIAGCGGSSAGAPLAAQDSAILRQDVSTIRTAAANSNPGGAHAAAAKLQADVRRLLAEGRLSPADARSILTAVGLLDGRIAAEVHAPTPTVTSSAPLPASAPTAPTYPRPARHHGPEPHAGPAAPETHGHGAGGGKDGGD